MRSALVSLLLLFTGSLLPVTSVALEIGFEGVAPSGQEAVFSGVAYTEQGFELTGSPDFSVLSRFYPGVGIEPESDYGYIHDAPAFDLQRADAQEFSIQCLVAAQINGAEDGRLTVTGTRKDGRVLKEVFSTISNELNLLVFPPVWNSLVSVHFSSDSNFLAIDKVRLNEGDCLPFGSLPGSYITLSPWFRSHVTGYDLAPADGVFDELRFRGQGNFGSVILGSLEFRTNVEFDLGSIPDGSLVRSATLRFSFANPEDDDRNIDLYGYKGGGIIDLEDFTRGRLLEGRTVSHGTHDLAYDVTALVDNIVAAGVLPDWAGFSVRHRDAIGGLLMVVVGTPVLEVVYETVDHEPVLASFAQGQDDGPADGIFDTLDPTLPTPADGGLILNNGFIEHRVAVEFDLSVVPDGAILERASIRFEGNRPSTDRLFAFHGFQGDGSVSLADLGTEAFRFQLELPQSDESGDRYRVLDVTSEVQHWLYAGYDFGGISIRDVTASQPNELYRMSSPPILDLVFREEESSPASVAYWPFDTHAGDASGNGNDGTLAAGAGITGQGQLRGALDLRDVDGYVRLDHSPIVDAPRCTISYWVSTDSLSGDGYNAIFAHDRFDPGAVHANLVTGSEIAELAVAYLTQGNAYMDLQAGETWTHFAFSYDSVDNYVDLFLNGNWVGRQRPGATSACGNGAAATIGAWDDNGEGNFVRFHDGRIDELRIYDRLLTPSQIGLIGAREVIFHDGLEE